MSTIDERKEHIEYNCLIDAYNFCMNNMVPEQTRGLLKYLNGERVILEKNDSPDIINICKRGDVNRILVGIEHFKATSISKITSSGKHISLHQMHINNLAKITDEMIDSIEKDGGIQNELIDRNNKEIGKLAEDAINGSYESYIESFRTVWNKHASKIDNYLQKLEAVSKEKEVSNVELAFLIEIDSEFTDWFYNYEDGKFEYIKTGLAPVFKQIVSIINSTKDLKKINYVILYNRNINRSSQSVVAFRTGAIKSNLKKQGVPVFDYIGEERCKVVVDDVNKKDGRIEPNFHITGYTDEYILNELFPLYRKAMDLKKKHLPFVATRSVQHLIFVDIDNCSSKWEVDEKSNKFSKLFTPEENDKKYDRSSEID